MGFLEDHVLEVHQQSELKYELAFPNSQRAIDEAENLGLAIVFPKDNQLQLDIDNDEAMEQFEKLRDVVEHHFGITDVEVHPSKSGLPKRHVTITMPTNMATRDRILIQACLGSDRTRELLSYLQVLNGDAHPVLFIERPEIARAAILKTLSLPPSPQYKQLAAGLGDVLKDEDIPY